MEQTKRKYRGIEDVYEAAEELKRPAEPSPSPSGGQTPSVPLSIIPTAASTTAAAPVAPARDFNKRANSLERVALPAGVFPGSSKKIYDALYVRTRGAVKPTRTLRATKRDLAEWSGVRNRKTIDSHLRYLETCGLLKRQWETGATEGYLFEVMLPEETPLVDRGGQTPSVHQTPGPSDQKRDRGTDQKGDRGGQGETAENTGSYESPKTFIRQERTDDDEGFAPLLAAAKEIVGREVDPQQWRELAELLAVELKIAAGRTTVSSPGAFLAEHLRRRLWKKEKRQLDAEGASPSASAAQAGKAEASQCPDCRGTGMWYPEGFEKGVARCKHQKLTGGPAPGGEAG